MKKKLSMFYQYLRTDLFSIKNNLNIFYHYHRRNFGDILNEHIIPKLFGTRVKYASPEACDIASIGSIIGNFLESSDFCKDMNRPDEKSVKTATIWGCGLILPCRGKPIRDLEYAAVRGKLTADCLGIECAYGDPGIFCNELIDRQEKRYKLGIVPHYADQGLPVVDYLQDREKCATIIDVLDDPLDVIKRIDECEVIISSSLHGLVASDALGIPNMRIRLSDKLAGDHFKFMDYYSAYDVPYNYIENANIDVVSHVKAHYQMTEGKVDDVKKGLIDSYERAMCCVGNGVERSLC